MAAPLKRVIKDYNTLTQEHIDLINEHYPNGFENENLVSFVTPKGQFIKALEVRTDDTIYLFKIDKNMKVDDEENQENEGAVMSEFESFKSGSGDDELDDMDDSDDDDADADIADDDGDADDED
ncbi:MAG: DNA primase [Flavobacteriales bacterium]